MSYNVLKTCLKINFVKILNGGRGVLAIQKGHVFSNNKNYYNPV